MRILVDARSLIDPVPGGVGRVAKIFIINRASSHPSDEIVCVTTGWQTPRIPSELSEFPNVRFLHIRIPNKLWSFVALCGCLSLFRAAERRVGPIDEYILPNIGFIGRLPRRVPTTLIVHDLSFLVEPSWFTWKDRLWHLAVRARHLMQRASRIVAVSERTKQDLIQILKIPQERISIFPPLVSAMDRMPEQKKPSDQRTVLTLGFGNARKNIDVAVESIRRLRMDPAYSDLVLILVGAARRPLSEKWIRFVRQPTDHELSSLYQHASVLLYPSWYEGYGLPLHEAAAHGVPCIASTAAALPETAPRGTIFADPAKPHHWVAALRMALGVK